MAHGTESADTSGLTSEEKQKLAKLLKHPRIGQLLEEVDSKEDK